MASEDRDSRTSSVGRKRGYEEFVPSEAKLDRVEGISADNYDEQPEKRRRHNSSSTDEDGYLISSDEAPLRAPGVEQFEPHTGLANHPIEVAENCDVDRPGEEQVPVAISPAVTWNKGIPIAIRTTFGASTFEKQPQSCQPPFAQWQKAAQPVQTVGRVSMQATEALFTEETVNASALPSPQMPATPKTITDTVRKPRQANMPDSNCRWRWIFKMAHLKDAEKIVKALPENKRDLMPRQVSDGSLFFTNKGCRFALPRLFVSLREICFVDQQKPSFVLHFLNVNLAVLERIDHNLLLMAFKNYLGLFYGHLPKSLISLLRQNKRITSSVTKVHCIQAIADAMNLQRTLLADNAKGETDLDDVEQKSSGNQETSPDDQPNRQADEIQNPNSSTENSRNGSNVQPQRISADERMADVAAVNIPPRSDPGIESIQYGSDFRPGFCAFEKESLNMDAEDAEVTMDVTPTVAESRYMSKNNAPQRSGTGVGAPELELLHRYYPADNIDPSIPRCLTCSDLDHRTSDCPFLTCATCGLEGIHFTDACPQSQRCTRCRNRGHDKSRCSEKLAATSGEVPRCDICQSKNHLEVECHFLWRSFRPDSLRQKRLLEDIPVFCYCCGANTHFGSECGIRSSPLYSDSWTWSRVNWERYIDMKSNKRVFSAGQSYEFGAPNRPKKDLSIRGKAKHEPVGLDDDDDVQFISQRVTIPPPPVIKGKQNIKFVGKKHLDEEAFIPRPDLRLALPNSRQQPQRATKPQRHPEDRGVDSFNSYRPSNDESARGRRERSFSPPPRVTVRVNDRDQYGDMSYRPDYGRDFPPSFKGYSDGQRGDDSLRGPDPRGDNAKGFGGRGSGRGGRGGRGGGGRSGRRKRKAEKLRAASSLARDC